MERRPEATVEHRLRRHGRWVTVLALASAAFLELLYGCVGDSSVESFVKENIGETAEALTCDYINCVAPGPCYGVTAICGASGQCQYAAVATGTSCGTGEVCSSGSCVAECYIAATLYAAGATNPSSACQVCTPSSSTTSWSTAADGTSCPGAGNVCVSGSCMNACFIGGTHYTTGTVNPNDSCQVCTPTSSTSAWSSLADGSSCGGGMYCQGGTCRSDCLIVGSLYASGATNPNNSCQVCSPSSSTTAWSNAGTGTSCGNGLVCVGGSCSSGCDIGGTFFSAGTVNPNEPCQACLPGTSTTSWSNKTDGAICNDGNPCTSGDACMSGACTGTPVTCTPLDSCHEAGSCNTGTGICSNPNQPDNTSCGSGNVCMGGICGGINKCVGVTCTAMDQCHAVGTCAPASGICTNPNLPDGTTCDDGNQNTVNDTCQNGTCAGVDMCTTVTCTAEDQCHDVGTCDPSTGVCSSPAKTDGTSCNDGDDCTTDDTCQLGACNAGPPKTCAVLDQCHLAGSCDSKTGACSNPTKPDGTGCGTGQVCTSGMCGGVDNCTGVACKAIDECHRPGTCAPASGVCTNPSQPDGTACTQAGSTSSGDVCLDGVCGPSPCATVTCPAPDECHEAATCDAATGQCSSVAKPDGTTCSAGSCESGKCTSTNYYACAATPDASAPPNGAAGGAFAAALALACARLRRRRSRERELR